MQPRVLASAHHRAPCTRQHLQPTPACPCTAQPLPSVQQAHYTAGTRCTAAPRSRHRRAAAAAGVNDAPPIEPITPRDILVIGRTGRVGSAAAACLLQLTRGHNVTLAGRSRASFDAAVARKPELEAASFAGVDIADFDAVRDLAAGRDLVIHTAGPFQRRSDLTVLRACIAARTPYLDVCDDQEHSVLTKALHGEAAAAGVPCITTAGIYPGVSNVMAAHMCAVARREYDEDDTTLPYRMPAAGEGVQPRRLLYSYFTAGTGGVGPTILETTFLLAGEPAVAYRDGVRYALPPVSERRTVDYGPGLGRRDAWLYNLPEVRTGHEVLRVPNVSARFGTSPYIWNIGTWLVARLAPKGFLEDRGRVAAFAKWVGPLVRATDAIAGEAVGMRVEVQLESGHEVAGLFVHKYCSEAVGSATAAFAEALLEGGTEPGVWYPEEQGALNCGRARLRVMHRAAQGYSKPAFRFEVNRPLWRLESDPKYIAMGMYL